MRLPLLAEVGFVNADWVITNAIPKTKARKPDEIFFKFFMLKLFLTFRYCGGATLI